jgi:catechol 2,3-dioxygenase-like lactoylglutathione lyase family enzyme
MHRPSRACHRRAKGPLRVDTSHTHDQHRASTERRWWRGSGAEVAERARHYDRHVPEPEPARSAASLQKFAPAFPVGDLVASLAHYERLGFTTSEYTGISAAGGYGFARRDGVELQLGTVPAGRTTSPMTAYLYVDDADALAAEWLATGAVVHSPQDTPWGQREGVMIDPDGNIIRFGSAL